MALTRVTTDAQAPGGQPNGAGGAQTEEQQALLELLAPLLAEFERNRPEGDRDVIVEAARMALRAHEGQFRRSGEPYITHPVAVATIVAELRLDEQTVAAARCKTLSRATSVSPKAVAKDMGILRNFRFRRR